MAYFEFKFNGNLIQFRKNEFYAANSDLFAIRQMPEVGQVEFYVDGKKTDLIGVQNEINKLHDEKVAKKELTHKKIFVGDGITHLRKKAVWIRR